jgi:hypothetical protein
MIARTRRFFSLALRVKGMIDRERKYKSGLGLRDRWAAWRRGFVSESLMIYEMNKQPAAYLSDFARHVRTPDINERFKSVLDNKFIFSKVFGPHLFRTPRVFFWLDKGKTYSFRDEDVIKAERADIIELCRGGARLIVKSVDGGGGANVFAIRVEGEDALINHSRAQISDLERLLATRINSIVIDFVEQHQYAWEIFPRATNTVRLLTMWDYDVGRPFIAAAVHRFGRTPTIPVDNWSRGGLSVSIDLGRGQLGKGVMHPSTGDRGWHATHPETGRQIEGVTIPGWENICTKILHAASTVPFLPYVGWDVVVTGDGFTVLEGNNFSDVNLLQVHKPLLEDPRVKKFYEHHGVI